MGWSFIAMIWWYSARQLDHVSARFGRLNGQLTMEVGMNPVRFIAKAALAGIFITGGLNAFKDPKPLATIAKPTVERLGTVASLTTGIPGLDKADPAFVVRANGAAQVLGGLGLLTNWFRRPAALGLALSLVPTTLAGHPFWKMTGNDRASQQVHFTKNLGILGGLLLLLIEPRRKPLIAIGKGTTQDISTAVGTVVDKNLPKVQRYLGR